MNLEDTKRLSIPISGMTCAACVIHITNSLESVDGIKDVSVNLATEKANIKFDTDSAPLKNITEAIEDAGYLVRIDNVRLLAKQIDDTSSLASAIHMLKQSQGVVSISAENNSNQVNISYLQGLLNKTTIQSAFQESGYTISFINELTSENRASHHDFPFIRSKLIMSISFTVLIMACMSVPELTSWMAIDTNWIYFALSTPVQLWGASQFYSSSWKALLQRTTNMNTLISVGTTVAYGYSVAVTIMGDSSMAGLRNSHTYFDTSTAIIGLVLLGRFLEIRARRKASDSIKALLDLNPE
ncbi:MAG: copper ion binding protein, partial [Anaerolineales bacterium]|nr:copper ion binding protein [Anaerolineales bacterium]